MIYNKEELSPSISLVPFMFRNEEDFKRATGMTTIEFTRFIRKRAEKNIDKALSRKKL